MIEPAISAVVGWNGDVGGVTVPTTTGCWPLLRQVNELFADRPTSTWPKSTKFVDGTRLPGVSGGVETATLHAEWASARPPVPEVNPMRTVGGSVMLVSITSLPATKTRRRPAVTSTSTWVVAFRRVGTALFVTKYLSVPGVVLVATPTKLAEGSPTP